MRKVTTARKITPKRSQTSITCSRSSSRQNSVKEVPLELHDIEDEILTEYRNNPNDKDSNDNNETLISEESTSFIGDIEANLNSENKTDILEDKDSQDTDVNYTSYVKHHSNTVKLIYENKKLTANEKQKFTNEINSMLLTLIEQSNRIASVTKELEMIKKQSFKSYAEAISQKTTNDTESFKQSMNELKRKQTFAVIVKPKIKQNNDLTLKDLKANVNPIDLNIGIEDVKQISDGGLIIKTNSTKEVEKIRDELSKNSEITKKYNISLPKKRQPQIILYNVNNDTNEEEIISSIIKNNKGINDGDIQPKMQYTTNGKKCSNWILEIKPHVLKKLEPNKLTLGWQRVTYKENIKPTRCYNCNRYGHKSNVCKNKKVCIKCGSDEHTINNCSAIKPNCINCRIYNQRFNTKIQTDHMCTDNRCHCWQIEKNKIIAHTDYGE